MTGRYQEKAFLVSQSDDNSSIDPERCVDEYGDDLFRYGMSRLRDDNAAEEVVQETFLAGVRFQDRYTGEGAERAWLPGILKRKLMDYVCRRSRYDRDGSDEGSNSPSEKMFDENGNWKSGSFPAQTTDGQVASREVCDVDSGFVVTSVPVFDEPSEEAFGFVQIEASFTMSSKSSCGTA